MDFSYRANKGASILEKSVQWVLTKTGLDTYVSKAMSAVEKYIPQSATKNNDTMSSDSNNTSSDRGSSDGLCAQPSSPPQLQHQSPVMVPSQPIQSSSSTSSVMHVAPSSSQSISVSNPFHPSVHQQAVSQSSIIQESELVKAGHVSGNMQSISHSHHDEPGKSSMTYSTSLVSPVPQQSMSHEPFTAQTHMPHNSQSGFQSPMPPVPSTPPAPPTPPAS